MKKTFSLMIALCIVSISLFANNNGNVTSSTDNNAKSIELVKRDGAIDPYSPSLESTSSLETTVSVDTLDCYDPTQATPTAPCPKLYKPVCACGVMTFANACEAKRFGFINTTEGACITP